MLHAFACCCILACAAALAPSASAEIEAKQDERGDTTLLMRVLAQQNRPLFGTSAAPGARFGPLVPIGTPYPREQTLAVDDRGGAVAAWTEVPPGAYEAAVMVSVKPPGGVFGPPQRLSNAGSRVSGIETDVNPRGDAVVVWNDFGQVEYSYRPAGAAWSDGAPVPGPINEQIRPFLEAGGGFLLVGTGSGPDTYFDQAFTTYREPDGTFRPWQALQPAPDYFERGELTSNRRGDVLLTWSHRDESDPYLDRIMVRERPAGGEFGPVREIDRMRDVEGRFESVRSALDDRGDALIAVSYNGALAVYERPAKGDFGKRTTVSEHYADADVTMNKAGAAILWFRHGRRILAAQRLAGGPFSRAEQVGKLSRLLGGSGGYAGLPALTIDGTGTGTVMWEDSTGEAVRVRSRRVSAAGLAPRATVATVPAFVQEAPPSTCTPEGSSVLLANRRAVITTSGQEVSGCLLARGVPLSLEHGWPSGIDGPRETRQARSPVALGGPFAASVISATNDGGVHSTWISTVDLRDNVSGESRYARALGEFGNADVPVLKQLPSGAQAWVACPYPEADPPRARCANGGQRVKQLFAWGTRGPKPRLLATGRGIDPRSLKLRGGRVSWRDGKRRRSAILR